MSEFSLRNMQTRQRESAFVAEAAVWAKALVHAEARFPGDYQPAMRRVARRLAVPLNAIAALHYRKPKTISVDRYVAIFRAYADEQAKKYRKERSRVALTPLGEALARAADSLAGEDGL